jgi:hypothetical protein
MEKLGLLQHSGPLWLEMPIGCRQGEQPRFLVWSLALYFFSFASAAASSF